MIKNDDWWRLKWRHVITSLHNDDLWRNGVINNSLKWRWWCQALGILGDASTSRHKWRFVMSFFLDFLQFVNDTASWFWLTSFLWFQAKFFHEVLQIQRGDRSQNLKLSTQLSELIWITTYPSKWWINLNESIFVPKNVINHPTFQLPNGVLTNLYTLKKSNATRSMWI